MAHYSMGWLPLLARIAAVAPRTINTVAHTPGITTLLRALGGIDQHRDIPSFAPQRFTQWFAHRPAPSGGDRPRALLWPDTFTNNFDTGIARDAVEVLEAAGFAVEVPQKPVCCGLTWISTGQLDTAKRIARRTLDILGPAIRDGVPVVVLEPSCAAVFRSDLPELLHGDEDAHRLARLTRTLGEVLAERGDQWHPPTLGETAIVQPHCHQHAILGMSEDSQVLTDAGVDTTVLDAGCCGLAGNFGFESGHYGVSVACAEDKLMPAVRAADADTLVLADGFSCRTQIRSLSRDRTPLHSAQVLAAGLRGERPMDSSHTIPVAPHRRAVQAGIAVAVLAAGVFARRRSHR
jgi:Fe-S oxidoreductase